VQLLLAAALPVGKKTSGPVNGEEVKNNQGFAMPVNARLTVGALEKLPAKVKIFGTKSVCESVASSSKTASGAIKKHCEPCELKLIGNWAQHKKDKHEGVDVPSVKCTGE
jgi:hypothetical protein